MNEWKIVYSYDASWVYALYGTECVKFYEHNFLKIYVFFVSKTAKSCTFLEFFKDLDIVAVNGIGMYVACGHQRVPLH